MCRNCSAGIWAALKTSLSLQLGEAAKLKPLEIELKRLEDLSESIVQDFSYMRQREEEMRDTNGNWYVAVALL